MAISDINKAMGLYAQPSEFDQNAWKTAFDMADRFAQTSEKHRANVENLATQDARLQHQNWEFLNKEKTGDLNYLDKQRQYNNALQTDPSNIQATIAGNQYSTTSSDIARQGLLGQQELTQKLSQYALNPDGTYRSLPEAYAAMTGAGEKLSPYAFSSVYQAGMQQRTNEQAALEGIAANSMETTTDALGNIVPTGRIDPSLFEQKLNQAVATGGIRQATADAFKNQLFPAIPTTSTAQPQGMITPAQAQSFSEQFSQINQRLQPITVPFAVGNTPVMATVPPVTATPVQNTEVVMDKSIEPNNIIGQYNVDSSIIPLIKQLAEVRGLPYEQVLKDNAARFNLVNTGYLAWPELQKYIQRDIDNERNWKQLRQVTKPMQEQGYRILQNDPNYIG